MRIEPKPLSSYPCYLRPFFWNQRRKYGAILDSALLWARAPLLFLGVAFLYGAIDIVELTGLIAFQNLSSRFNAALGVPAQGFCRLPAVAARDHADGPR